MKERWPLRADPQRRCDAHDPRPQTRLPGHRTSTRRSTPTRFFAARLILMHGAAADSLLGSRRASIFEEPPFLTKRSGQRAQRGDEQKGYVLRPAFAARAATPTTYQTVERKLRHHSKRSSKWLRDFRHPVTIVTKSGVISATLDNSGGPSGTGPDGTMAAISVTSLGPEGWPE